MNALRTESDHAHILPPIAPIQIGGQRFDFKRPAWMGVINLSADSFYKPSVCVTSEAAIARGHQLLEEGADFIDIGAEASGIDAKRVAPHTQIKQLIPVVKALVTAGALISVESYHPPVLEAAAEHGAALFNLSGVRDQQHIFEIAARFDVTVIHCYLQGQTAREHTAFTESAEQAEVLKQFFADRLAEARALGVKRHVLDAGIGFSYHWQTAEQRISYQLRSLLNSHTLSELGCPILNVQPHAGEVFDKVGVQVAAGFFDTLALLGGTHILRTQLLPEARAVWQALAMGQST